MLFLGIDVGGSKTHALLADESGQVLGFGYGPGGNPEMAGYSGLTAAMQIAMQQALAGAGVEAGQVNAAGFGIAGYDWPHQTRETLTAVMALGLQARMVIENDATLPIMAGTSCGWGIAACVGTGNNVRGVDAHGRVGRITGNSASFGEFGGAGEIMQVTLQRLAWMWTGRIPQTTLAKIIYEGCGASNLDDFIEGLVQGKYQIEARQAPLVVNAALAGDEVAREILRWNAQELAESVVAVAGQLYLLKQPFEVVMSGTLFEMEIYQAAFREQVLQKISQPTFLSYNSPPVIGAVLLALQAEGIQLQIARKRLLAYPYTEIASQR